MHHHCTLLQVRAASRSSVFPCPIALSCPAACPTPESSSLSLSLSPCVVYKLHKHRGTNKPTLHEQTHFITANNMNRKQIPANNDDINACRSSNFNSSALTLSSLLIPPSFDPNDTSINPPLFPTRRRFEHTPPVILPKPEPYHDFLLPPSPFHHLITTPNINAPTYFHHLPDHSTSSSSHKRPRTIKNAVVPTSSTLARQRRARLSDKTRCLQKLIPLDRQMDTATLYHETYKYVKFLEAQITVLQSMPSEPLPLIHTPTTCTTNHEFGGMGRLNRQQLLQILMSSQVAQTVMYTNGWCVFAAEQLPAFLPDRDQVVVEQRFI